jgi:hypothetical protein
MDDGFDMQPANSDHLVNVGFNESTRQGKIDFKKASYVYEGCTQEEADEIALGGNEAFERLWKGKKLYRKL